MVRLEGQTDLFEVSPTNIQGSGQVVLRMRDTCRIDYDRGARSYNLIVSTLVLSHLGRVS